MHETGTYDIGIMEQIQQQQRNIQIHSGQAKSSDYFMAYFLIEDESQLSQKQYEAKLSKKMIKLMLNILNEEMEDMFRISPSLKLLKICVDIYLQTQSYKAYFNILQLQSSLQRQSFKQSFILACLKKALIDNLNYKEKQKKEVDKIFLAHQLKFEKSFQKFISDIQKTTDLVEELWIQTASKNFRILSMFKQINQISQTYLQLWKKFLQVEDKYLNADLFLIFASFCDMVMCFEVEAENFWLKGVALQNSIKLQQQKGTIEVESKIRSQENLLYIECTTRYLDKIVFANQKFLQFSGYKIEDITTVKKLLPQIVAENHDEMITRFLTQNSPINHKLEVTSWLKVKKGYLVPVSVVSFPFVDMKHDLRFVAIIRRRKDIILEEQTIMLNSVFTFLVTQYCKIDSVSKECYDVYNICPKLLDFGLQMSHVFNDFKYDKMSDVQYGDEFQLNKEVLLELQQQLDIHNNQSDSESGSTSQFYQDNSMKAINPYQYYNQKNSRRLSLEDQHQVTYMKLYPVAKKLGKTEEIVYEVVAIPVIDHTQVNLTSSSFNPLSIMKSKNTLYEENLKPQDYISFQNPMSSEDENRDIGSHSSMTSSNSSIRSKQLDQIRDIKEITNLKGQPSIITRLSRSMNIFFFLMFITAIILLAINISDKINFQSGISAMEDAYRIQYYVANIRLRLIYIYSQANHFVAGGISQSQLTKIKLAQKQLGIFVEEFRLNVNLMNNAVNQLNSYLQNLFISPSMNVTEISSKGNLRNVFVSYQSSCQEIIQKADQYKYLDYSALKINRSIFGIDYSVPPPQNYTLSIDECNTFFILENLANSIRVKANDIQEAFAEEVIRFGGETKQNILIFTIVCICVVTISAILLMPLLFRIDNNLGQSIKSWTVLTRKQKEDQIERIRGFRRQLENTSFTAAGNKKSTKKLKISKIDEELKKGLKSGQLVQGTNVNQKINKKIKKENILDMDDEDEEEKIEEEYVPDHSKGKSIDFDQEGKKRKSPRKSKFIDRSSKYKIEGKDDEQKEHENDSDDESQKDVKQDQEEQEVDKHHRVYHQLSLAKYIFARKLKISMVVIFFTICLCSFFFGTYLVASTIYSETLEVFDILTNVSDRAPCVARTFFFFQYTLLYNKTIYMDGGEVMPSIFTNCLKLESLMRDIKKSQEKQLSSISSLLSHTDNNDLCDYYFTIDEFKGQIITQEQIDACRTVENGTLTRGLSSNIDQIYQHIQQRTIEFNSISTKRDLKYLQSMMYDGYIERLLFLYFDYLGPIIDQIQISTNDQLEINLQNDFENLVIMFSIFLIFILFTWYLSIRILIKALSKTVQRSKIALKMVPAEVLIEIKEHIKNNN